MTPQTFELMRTAARTLLAHRDAGRSCDPHCVQWAEDLLRANPRPKTDTPPPPASSNLPDPTF